MKSSPEPFWYACHCIPTAASRKPVSCRDIMNGLSSAVWNFDRYANTLTSTRTMLFCGLLFCWTLEKNTDIGKRPTLLAIKPGHGWPYGLWKRSQNAWNFNSPSSINAFQETASRWLSSWELIIHICAPIVCLMIPALTIQIWKWTDIKRKANKARHCKKELGCQITQEKTWLVELVYIIIQQFFSPRKLL